MNVLEAIKQRKSVRRFSAKSINPKLVKVIFEYAEYAPSAGNLKSRLIAVFKDKETKGKLCQAAFSQKFVSEAPVVFVFFANNYSAKYGVKGELYAVQDATIACAYAQLAAVELGLSSCWVGAFSEWEVNEIVGYHVRPIALLPIGYKVDK